jgi:AcrR family transcriptional regulator
MTTKNVILEKAIELFNENGYANVSMRDIADAADKSVGNITYHYRKKTDLICAIVNLQYEDLKSLKLNTDVDIRGFNEQLKMMISFQKKYYFYFSNMIELGKSYPEIMDFQHKVKNEFILYFIEVIKNFEERGIFRVFSNEDIYEHLAKGIVLIMMSWVQQIEPEDSNIHEELFSIVWSILYSNLSEKGLLLFQEEIFLL